MRNYELKDLEEWDAKITEKAIEFGLNCYPQEFEICDHNTMLGYMAYSGMPSHYKHWSYGKAYEKLKTLYDYGISGLPYEMVINSNPALAYLMRDNTLALQILTVAHVYGHNDFFKNNFTFNWLRDDSSDVMALRPANLVGTMKARARRIQRYIEDPSVGSDKVEKLLDASHALSFQCRRDPAIRKLLPEEQKKRLLDAARPKEDPFSRMHKREEYIQPDLHKIPLEPEEDILLFIRDYNPRLSEWGKDILTIVHEEAQYFLPQIETKIMNEGWASYWHREILNSLELTQDLHFEFIVRHNQVIRPHPGGLDPYHLGLLMYDSLRVWYDGSLDRSSLRLGEEQLFDAMFEDFEERGVEYKGRIGPSGTGEKTGREKLFEVRSVDRDRSFLRQYLTPVLMWELNLFEYGPRGTDLVVTKISRAGEWREVKETLLRNTGMANIPILKIEDSNYNANQTLYLKHDASDGRELEQEYAEKTLWHLQELWGRPVIVETILANKKTLLICDEKGKSITRKGA